MQVKENYVKKRYVEYCTEDYSLKEALQRLEETGYRCIPVLDRNGARFLGNIYKAHILKHQSKGSLSDSIMVLVKDQNETIKEDSPFSVIFETIKRLPYIAVVDDNGDFLGIVTHAKVLNILEDSWGINAGGYVLTVATADYSGALARMVDVVTKHSSIQSLMTLDTKHLITRRILVTLPKETTEDSLKRITAELDKKGYRVVHVDSLK